MSLPHFEPQPARFDVDQPMLAIVVDTEEEFDWQKPFDRSSTSTQSIPAQDKAHAIFDQFGLVPTYVVDYPVATSPAAAKYLRRLVDRGLAEFGTHCHPWVTPPHSETVSVLNSFHGNLPPEVEYEKIKASTEAVAQAFGSAPRVFKAGRYGVGPQTFKTLKELGYSVDCSFVPNTNFSAEGGPDFREVPDQPFFTDPSGELLEVPLTVGFSGGLNRLGRFNTGLLDSAFLQQLRVPGICSRLGILERSKLSPEGFDLATQKRLLKSMVGQGAQVFTLTYHSPTLQPGNTPYVRSDEDLRLFLENIRSILTFFKDQLDGRFTTMSQLDGLARRNRVGSHAAIAAQM